MKPIWKACLIMLIVILLFGLICLSLGMLNTYTNNKYKDNECLKQIGAYYCQSNEYKFVDIVHNLNYKIPVIRCESLRKLSNEYLIFKFTEAELRSCGI